MVGWCFPGKAKINRSALKMTATSRCSLVVIWFQDWSALRSPHPRVWTLASLLPNNTHYWFFPVMCLSDCLVHNKPSQGRESEGDLQRKERSKKANKMKKKQRKTNKKSNLTSFSFQHQYLPVLAAVELVSVASLRFAYCQLLRYWLSRTSAHTVIIFMPTGNSQASR